MSLEILDVRATKPFATATFDPVAEAAVNTGNAFQSSGYTGLFAAVKPRRAMWWRFMKRQHLAGVDGRTLRSER
ncbi:MAG: hypothetical protein GTO14_25135 [Anaerolineales bacterium]|nr:hypothetical protein [Anaerolineales bacterium]